MGRSPTGAVDQFQVRQPRCPLTELRDDRKLCAHSRPKPSSIEMLAKPGLSPKDDPFLTTNYTDKASCLSASVGRRDAAVKPTGMYSRRLTARHEALSMCALV